MFSDTCFGFVGGEGLLLESEIRRESGGGPVAVGESVSSFDRF